MAVFILNAAGKPCYSNEAALRLLGRDIDPQTHPQTLAETYQVYVAGTDTPYPADKMPLVRALHGEEAPTVDDMEIRPPGQRIALQVWAAPLRDSDGRVEYAIAAFKDISERKRVEAELLKVHGALKQTEAARIQLLNHVAHDMGTPMTAIRLQLRVMELKAAEGDVSLRNSLKMVQRNFDQLLRLAKDLKDLAQLQAGKLNLESKPLDLAQVVRDASEAFTPTIAGTQLRIELMVAAPLLVAGDAQRLTQVLHNFLSNAAKFAPPLTAIVVQVKQLEGEAVVRVSDSGRGLTSEEISRLFAPFVQIHQPGEAKHAGTGLGLYICKGLIEGHGGRIWVESQGPGHGATFAFALPLQVPTS